MVGIVGMALERSAAVVGPGEAPVDGVGCTLTAPERHPPSGRTITAQNSGAAARRNTCVGRIVVVPHLVRHLIGRDRMLLYSQEVFAQGRFV
jgi:hypothetical protein